MADQSKVTKTNASAPLSHTDLLASGDWQHIQSLLAGWGKDPSTLALIAPKLWHLLRKWERLLPVAYRLPPPIRDTLSLVLTERTYTKPGPHSKLDREEIGRFMYDLLGPPERKRRPNMPVVKATMKAVKKFECASATAEKWYYSYAKNLPR